MGFGAALRDQVPTAATPAPPAHVEDEPPAHPAVHADGANVHGNSAIAAAGLGAGADHGPHLNSFWNHLFGGPATGTDGRPLSQNHIGARQGGGPFHEDGPLSSLMRSVPYFGDYWEALSVTHDAAHFKPGLANGVTAVTNVGLPGPLMGIADAPFRAFGHSLFLDHK